MVVRFVELHQLSEHLCDVEVLQGGQLPSLLLHSGRVFDDLREVGSYQTGHADVCLVELYDHVAGVVPLLTRDLVLAGSVAALELSGPLRVYFRLHHVHLAVDDNGVGPPLVAERDLPDGHQVRVHSLLLQRVICPGANACDLRRDRLLRLQMTAPNLEAADPTIPAALFAGRIVRVLTCV